MHLKLLCIFHTTLHASLLTYSTTRLERLRKALSGIWLMRLRARVMACREARLLRAPTGISVSALSSSQRCLRDRRPEKVCGGTSIIRLASRRLGGQDGIDLRQWVNTDSSALWVRGQLKSLSIQRCDYDLYKVCGIDRSTNVPPKVYFDIDERLLSTVNIKTW